MTLIGDQLCVAATDEHQDGQRLYIVWMLSDDNEQGYQARLPADSPGQAIDMFVKLLADKRAKQFSWRGRAKLEVVK